MQQLLPHVAAIESYREAATNGVLPPCWREQPAPNDVDSLFLSRPEERRPKAPLDIRKQLLLIRNASAAQAWVRKRFAPGSPPLSLDDIFNLHRMVADESGLRDRSGGVFRDSGVQVGRREVGGMHSGAPAEKLPLLMELYVRFINGDLLRSYPAAIHAMVAHFFFTTVHPFGDGNGRMCRLISAAILFQRGYNGHGLYALSRHFYQNDIRYHTLLHRCWQEGLPFDLTMFVAFGMEGLTIELQGIRSFVKIKLNRVVDRETLTPALKKMAARIESMS